MAGIDEDLAAVAADLYVLDPPLFTGTRDARAAEARAAGRRELAAAIKALRRPSAAAWALNLLARERAEDVDRLADLGARLREAQEALSGEEMRALGRQRQGVVHGLARAAASLAAARGHPVSDAARRDVAGTLEAALADPAAAAAVRSGRLVRPLEPGGFSTPDLSGAVAGGEPAAPPPGAGRGAPRPEAEAAHREEADRRRAAEAARAAEEAAEAARAAEEAAAQAERELAAAARAAEEAERRAAETAAAVRDIEGRLAAARREHAEASRAAEKTAGERDAAAGRAQAAGDEARRARVRAAGDAG